jgi:ribosomal protein L44E
MADRTIRRTDRETQGIDGQGRVEMRVSATALKKWNITLKSKL